MFSVFTYEKICLLHGQVFVMLKSNDTDNFVHSVQSVCAMTRMGQKPFGVLCN